jgi:hypothetical protein
MPALAAFTRGEGMKINKALRARLPHLRFTFDKYAGDQGDNLIADLFASAPDVSPTLRAVAAKLTHDAETKAVGSAIDQLCSMAEANQLKEEDLLELARLAGEIGEVGGAEPLLDPSRITLSPIPGRAMRSAFQQALIHGTDLTERERDTLELFVVATSNIEQLLSLYFTRYTVGTRADKKTYLYLAWMLWAFLRFHSAGKPPAQRGIYSRLAQLNGDIITFNYTNFFDSTTVRRVKFFHGRLDEYLRLDTRSLVGVSDDANLRNARDTEGIVNFVETLRLDVNNAPAIDVPSIVPPISFKPVMSRRQLSTWASCDDLLHRAGAVVIVGYSFGMADEHFNDLLRNLPASTRVLVVNTSRGPADAAARILGLDPKQFAPTEVDGQQVLRCGRLTAIEAKAEDLDEPLMSRLIG